MPIIFVIFTNPAIYAKVWVETCDDMTLNPSVFYDLILVVAQKKGKRSDSTVWSVTERYAPHLTSEEMRRVRLFLQKERPRVFAAIRDGRLRAA